ncbi:MAG: DUF882 domain-containing protein [Polyangiaceae bacterium]
MRRALPHVAALALTLTVSVAGTARADVTHVVQKGHTIESIAHRYHVTVKAIVEANHLADPKHLKPGQVLVIPGTEKPRKRTEKERAAERAAEKAEIAKLPEKLEGAQRQRDGSFRVAAAFVETRAERKEHGHVESDSIHAVRLGEDFHIRVKDVHGHIPPNALMAFEHLMRQNDNVHVPDPRLVALVGIVSNHFGGKTLEVVSGFRAYTPTQYTPHSNHNYGKAMDFRIRGVRNEELRDFCRTLRNAGCGYYPNSTFVHMDVRDTKAYWVDLSHPGEPPRYEKPGSLADEGISDVPVEAVEPAPEQPVGASAPGGDSPAGASTKTDKTELPSTPAGSAGGAGSAPVAPTQAAPGTAAPPAGPSPASGN